MNYLRSLIANFRHLASIRTPGQTNAGMTLPVLPTDEDPRLQKDIRWQWIPEGRDGTIATLRVMANLARTAGADRDFRRFAEQFTTWQDLLDWVRLHFIYRDEVQEVVRAPQRMLADMGSLDGTGRQMRLEGDCDDIATFLAAVLKIIGYRARLVAIRANAASLELDHVFAQAFAIWNLSDSGEWVTLDPTVQPGTTMTVLDELIESV